MTKPKIFISYAHSDIDSNWMQTFVQTIKDRGVDVWYDRFEIRPGDTIQEAIEKGLRNSTVIVFLLTEKSVFHASTLFELGAAIGMGKRVVGIVPEDLDISLLPQSFRNRRYLIKKDPEDTACKVLDAMLDATNNKNNDTTVAKRA